MRNPFPAPRYLPWGEVLSRHPELWERFTLVQVLRGFAPDFRRIIERDRMITTAGAIGVIATGSFTRDLVKMVIRHLPEGTFEFVCHPGYNDADLGNVRTKLRESRVRELEILTSPEIRAMLMQREVELINFWDLQRERQAMKAAPASPTAVPGPNRTAV